MKPAPKEYWEIVVDKVLEERAKEEAAAKAGIRFVHQPSKADLLAHKACEVFLLYGESSGAKACWGDVHEAAYAWKEALKSEGSKRD